MERHPPQFSEPFHAPGQAPPAYYPEHGKTQYLPGRGATQYAPGPAQYLPSPGPAGYAPGQGPAGYALAQGPPFHRQALPVYPSRATAPTPYPPVKPPTPRPYQAPPEQKSTAMPNLQFLKTATTISLMSSDANLAALNDATSWFAAAAAIAKERMNLAKEIQEACERVVVNIRVFKGMQQRGIDVAGAAVGDLECTVKETGVGDLKRQDGKQNGGVKNTTEENEGEEYGLADIPRLVLVAKENINHLRVLRAKWNAGGKNLEDISGFRQSRGIRSAKAE